MSGIFISLEGSDGAGKSTQAQLLSQYLIDAGYQVVMTREPGGTGISEQIREILLNPENMEMVNRTEMLLYAAARAQHVEQVIIPALQQGKVVICDRFIDSTIAYQGFGRGFEIDFLNHVNQLATGGLVPHITLLFDIPLEVGLERIKTTRKNKEDRLEQQAKEFYLKVREGYLHLAKKYPERIKLVPANQSIEEVFTVVKSHINDFL